MVAYLTDANTALGAQTGDQVHRLAAAIANYCVATVSAEGGAVAGHAARVAYAATAMANLQNAANVFLLPVIVFMDISGTLGTNTDAQVLAAVAAVYNTMAGVP